MDVPTTPVSSVVPPVLTRGTPIAGGPLSDVPNASWRIFTPWIVSGLVYLIIFLFILVVLPMGPWYSWKRVVAQYITGTEYVIAGSSVMGEGYFDVNVRKANLKKPGWIVVSAVANEHDMRCSQVYGKSDLLPAGKITNATIRLPNISPEVLDDTTNQPSLTLGTILSVGIAYDDGTGSFENHILLRDSTGALIFSNTTLGVAK